MTVITRRRTEKFALIPNEVAEDNRLSFAARGVLCYLLAKPNNWKVQPSDLQVAGSIGRDAVYRLLKELRDVGYIVMDQKRVKNSSRFGEFNYIVYDCAVPPNLPLEVADNEPLPEKPEAVALVPEKPEAVALVPEILVPGKLDTGNAARINKNPSLTKPKLIKTQCQEAFETLWQKIEPAKRPDNRTAAENLFLNLPSDMDRSNAVEFFETYRLRELQRKHTVKLFEYLQKKEWRELVDAPPFDRDGEYIITPDREEWHPWLEDIRLHHGDTGVAMTKRLGKIIRKKRWPASDGARQLGMSLGAA